MDNREQAILLVKMRATEIVLHIHDNFCNNCHKPHSNCSPNKCFWSRMINEIREVYELDL